MTWLHSVYCCTQSRRNSQVACMFTSKKILLNLVSTRQQKISVSSWHLKFLQFKLIFLVCKHRKKKTDIKKNSHLNLTITLSQTVRLSVTWAVIFLNCLYTIILTSLNSTFYLSLYKENSKISLSTSNTDLKHIFLVVKHSDEQLRDEPLIYTHILITQYLDIRERKSHPRPQLEPEAFLFPH